MERVKKLMRFPYSFLYNNKPLTMQYPLEELDLAIDYYLSLDKNKWFSENVIYNDLQKLEICPELHKPEKRAINKRIFKSTCRCMQTQFNNIVSYTSNKNVIHLKFDTTLETNADEEEHDSEFETALEIARETNNPFAKFDDSTVIHEVCRTGNLELLKEITSIGYFNDKHINIHMENDRCESLIELIDLKHHHAKKMLLILDECGFVYSNFEKDKLQKTQRDNRMMEVSVEILNRQLAESRNRVTTYVLISIIMTVLFVLAIFFSPLSV